LLLMFHAEPEADPLDFSGIARPVTVSAKA
jgi:hypothetical protein